MIGLNEYVCRFYILIENNGTKKPQNPIELSFCPQNGIHSALSSSPREGIARKTPSVFAFTSVLAVGFGSSEREEALCELC